MGGLTGWSRENRGLPEGKKVKRLEISNGWTWLLKLNVASSLDVQKRLKRGVRIKIR